ncbi:MAG: hypothetical protein KA113_04290 [Syntrophaceae bacterium]|nr:hypothetical protein [Syntrophaceae bacterium]
MGFEPGGYADKLGNRYESRWVAKQLLRLLNEEIQSVTIEAIGDDEKGVDLWIGQNNGLRQAQQCKARNRSEESWSINDLKSRNIFNHAKFQLDNNANSTFAFVSAVAAQTFHDLCDSARNSNLNPEDFYKYQVEAVGQTRSGGFKKFCEAIQVNSEDPLARALAFNYLRRMDTILYPDDHNNWQNLLADAQYLLTGAPETIVSTLIAYAENNYAFRKPIYANELREHLATLNIRPKLLAHDVRIAPVIEELQKQFEESIRPRLICGNIIPREETTKLIELIRESSDAILHGTAGNGKSVVLYELTQNFRLENIPFLPIRLDRREPKNTAAQFGGDMGLPDSPVYSLIALAGERPCVLLLDQLDAIRWTSSHSANALDVCKEMFRQVKQLRDGGKRITVVLSCRSFDLENDPEIRNWLNTDKTLKKVEVIPLIAKALGEILGPSVNQMTNRQKQILACPQNLAMWMSFRKEKMIPAFRTVTELMRTFWQNRREVLGNAGIAMTELDLCINMILDEMERSCRVSLSTRILSRSPIVYSALQSSGIIQDNNDKVTFCHQSYLDYLIADRLLQQIYNGGGNIIEWFGPRERQSLFRREQLRQTLAMMSEESPHDFVKTVKSILESDKIRFHMKHVALELIGQLEDLDEELGTYCLELLARDYWKKHIIETVCIGHDVFVMLLIEKNIILEWLNSDKEDDINLALLLLRSVNDKIPDKITEVIEALMANGEPWLTRILTTLCWNVADDSDKMFVLRLKLFNKGVYANYVNWQDLCKKYPLRALTLIESLVATWSDEFPESSSRSKTSSAPIDRLDKLYDEDMKTLKDIAESHAVETWDILVPHIVRLTTFQPTPQYDSRLDKWQNDMWSRVDKYTDIKRGIVELVITAGQKLASVNPEELLRRTSVLENSISVIIQQIIINVYSKLTTRYADIGIHWLLTDQSRFRLGSGYDAPVWMPAVRLVKSLSPHCSETIFRKLETAIIHFHAEDEKRLAKHYLSAWRDGYFNDYWGRAQYFLLPALDSNRVLPTTVNLMAVLNRKYEKYNKDRFLKTGRTSGGTIVSKLEKSLDRISDASWQAIMKNEKIPLDHNQWQQIDEKHAATSTVWQFSRSLGSIAKRFPERFAQLALSLSLNTHPYYVSAIFDAFAHKIFSADLPTEEKATWRPATVNTVEKVFGRFKAGDDRDSAMSFCRLVHARSEENWSDATIERLIHYAKSHHDLEPDKLNMHCDKTANEATVRILYENTINCVRGVAAEAIGALLWDHIDWLDKLTPGIEALVRDIHPVVRMAAIDALLPVLNIDKDIAVNWFCLACRDDLRVAASPRAVYFFNHVFSSNAEQLTPLIKAMVNSPLDEVSQEGAEEVTARWLFHDYFGEELKSCINGSVPQRRGVAQVAAHFLHDDNYAERCQELLLPLMNDPEKEVRKELAGIFRNQNIFKAHVPQSFISTYIKSNAYVDAPSGIIDGIKEHPGSLLPLSAVIFDICKIFSTMLLEESRNLSSRIPHTTSEIYSLLLRLYEQAEGLNDAVIRDQCLDIWDMLFEKRVGMVQELTKAIEK